MSIGGSTPANPPPDRDRNWEMVNERYLERQLDKQNTGPHSIKREYLGNRASISEYHIRVDKPTGQLGIFQNSTGQLVEITYYFIK